MFLQIIFIVPLPIPFRQYILFISKPENKWNYVQSNAMPVVNLSCSNVWSWDQKSESIKSIMWMSLLRKSGIMLKKLFSLFLQFYKKYLSRSFTFRIWKWEWYLSILQRSNACLHYRPNVMNVFEEKKNPKYAMYVSFCMRVKSFHRND